MTVQNLALALMLLFAGATALKLNFIQQVASSPNEGKAKHRVIHLLSVGRQGSCFLGDMFRKQPVNYLFEPDELDGQGLWVTPFVENDKRMNCIYTCGGCDEILGYHAQGPLAGGLSMKEFCASSPEKEDLLAIKTVGGLVDLQPLFSLPAQKLQSTKFVLMIRDPRAQRYSAMKMNWKMPGEGCEPALLQHLSAKDLAKRVPKDNMRAAFFEHWSQDVETFVPELFEWAGVHMSDAVREEAVSEKKDSALEWIKYMPQYEVEAVNRGSYCEQYMKMVGYPMKPSSLTDYTNLIDPFEKPLTPAEAALLVRLQKGAAMFLRTNTSKAPPLLMNVPEPH